MQFSFTRPWSSKSRQPLIKFEFIWDRTAFFVNGTKTALGKEIFFEGLGKIFLTT